MITQILRSSLEGGWKLFDARLDGDWVGSNVERIDFIAIIEHFEHLVNQDDETEWADKKARSKTNNFVALVTTSELKAKRFKKVSAFDSRGFLKWKIGAGQQSKDFACQWGVRVCRDEHVTIAEGRQGTKWRMTECF